MGWNLPGGLENLQMTNQAKPSGCYSTPVRTQIITDRDRKRLTYVLHFVPWRDTRKKKKNTHTSPARQMSPMQISPLDGHTLSLSGPGAPACSQGWNKRYRWTILRFPSLPPSPFIHRRVIGSQFELPLCPLWTHFPPTECGRLMAESSRRGFSSASMGALNSLRQFPPVLHSEGGKGGGKMVNEKNKMGEEKKKQNKDGQTWLWLHQTPW